MCGCRIENKKEQPIIHKNKTNAYENIKQATARPRRFCDCACIYHNNGLEMKQSTDAQRPVFPADSSHTVAALILTKVSKTFKTDNTHIILLLWFLNYLIWFQNN